MPSFPYTRAHVRRSHGLLVLLRYLFLWFSFFSFSLYISFSVPILSEYLGNKRLLSFLHGIKGTMYTRTCAREKMEIYIAVSGALV